MTFDFSVFDKPIHEFTTEEMLTNPRAFGLTNASNVQRAICRAIDGLPLAELAEDPDVVATFGGAHAVAELPGVRPAEFVLLCGIRAGKSLISAACAVRAALTCDVSVLGPGEVPRVSVVSLTVNVARKTWRQHVRGRILASRELRARLIGDPMADSLTIRHPTGIPVDIQVVAGAKAAGSLIADWCATVIFDEAPRMVGASDGVVNLDHARDSVAGRLLPGAQVIMPGSPWAPFGPIYELVTKHWGRPSQALVVARAKAFQINPNIWTPKACDELRKRKPDAYEVDVLCNFKAPDASMFDADELEACAVLEGEQPPDPLLSYVAAIDPATRGNAWTLVVLANVGGGRVQVILARQWIGSSVHPLSPRAVLQEIAGILQPYRATSVDSDQWSADSLKDLALLVGLYLRINTVTQPDNVRNFETLKSYVTDRRIEMPRHAALLRDLGTVRKRVTGSSVSIDMPETADGRHCDFASALALGMSLNLPEPEAPPVEVPYADQRKAELSRIIERSNRRRGVVMPD